MDLIEATKEGDLNRVRELIGAGVDLDYRDENDRSALHWAVIEGYHDEALALINAGADINASDDDNQTPLMLAISETDEDAVIMLLEQPNIDLDGALDVAIESNYLDALNMLLESGADPNKEHLLYTPLMLAATRNEDPAFVEALLDKGADINLGSALNNTTPLMDAIRVGNIPIIQFLLSRPDLDVDIQDNDGWTALASSATVGTSKIVQLLINAGADPTIKTDHGKTPADLARKPKIKEMLEQYEADYVQARSQARSDLAKRAMLQQRIITGVNFPPELQLPQKQLPQNILNRNAYETLCSNLQTRTTKLQLQELAKSLGIKSSNKSKAALCQAIGAKLGL